MITRSILGLTGVLVLAALPAYAFQEQTVGGQQAPAAAATPQAAPAQSAPVDMQLSPAEAPKASEGTEVRIPGLGTLGVLPKMDFGLELLYGADGAKQPEAAPLPDGSSDGLEIRGTVKHKF
ncbi:MAG: hypothetical protein NW216_14070 [Hyphomicrobium sp.]|nr:hypothetical protein [Hyphomicrobium sp.]